MLKTHTDKTHSRAALQLQCNGEISPLHLHKLHPQHSTRKAGFSCMRRPISILVGETEMSLLISVQFVQTQAPL